MIDTLDSDLTGQPAAVGATPSAAPAGAQPGSDGVVLTKAEFDALRSSVGRLEKEIGGLKGDKDRGVVRATKSAETAQESVRELYAKFEEMRGKGLSPEQAAEQVEQRRLLDRMAKYLDVVESGGVPGGRAGSAGPSDVSAADVVTRFKLDPRDPQVAEMLGRPFASQRDAEDAAIELLQSRAQAPSPSPASAPAPAGRPAPSLSEKDAMLEQYRAQSKGLRGNDLVELKMQYRKRGLDIS